MKRKIFLMLLCFTLLLGAFSISAFAEDVEYEYYFKSCVFKSQLPTSFGTQFDVLLNFTSNGVTYSNFITPSGNTVKYDNQTCYNYSRWLNEAYRTIECADYVSVPENFYNFVINNSDSYDCYKAEVHNHSYSPSIISPTCTEKGYTLYTCTCGDNYTDKEVSPLGHNYSSVVTDPTCTTKGGTTYTCSICNDTYIDNEIQPLGHNYSSVVTEATCTKGGFTTHTCSTCGDINIDTEIDALGHSFAEQWCSVCRAPNPEYYVQSKDFSTVITSMGKQISVKTVVGVLGVVALACVGLVFMWFVVRKVISIFMKAFRKGKISI